MIAAIVLSAGKSERMGSPKALLQYRGQTFLATILAAISAAGIDHCIVVAGHHYDAIARSFSNVPVVFNPDYEQGMSTSVKAGIRALPPGMDGAAIFLVDHPVIDPATVKALISQLQPDRIVVPVYCGRRGHPAIFGSGLFDEILGLGADQGLNTVVKHIPGRVIEVSVEDAGVLRDIDTPEQFAKLLAGDQ